MNWGLSNQAECVMKAPMEILYVDDDLIVVNKWPELLSVPGKTIADCVPARLEGEFGECLPVHRLDMPTSGILLVGRNKAAHRALSIQFEKRAVSKCYETIIWGLPWADKGCIDLPLICDWPNRPKQMVDHFQGKPSLTQWEVVSRDPQGQWFDTPATHMRLFPQTGRSHQLRVHMMALGHPILGDSFYAQPEALQASIRMLLHASRLVFHHPVTNDCLDIHSDPRFFEEWGDPVGQGDPRDAKSD